jgi:hypothetical protein
VTSRIAMAVLIMALPASPSVPARTTTRPSDAQGCGVLTGLASRQLPLPKTHVNRFFLDSRGSTILSQNAMRVKNNAPVTELRGVVEYDGRIPEPSPVLTLQIHVIDTIERPIDQRQLVLMLDDSVRMEFGSMRVYLLSKPNAQKVEQNLTADIPAHPFELLTYARRASILLGDTEIELTPTHLDGLRALYVAAVCGAKS